MQDVIQLLKERQAQLEKVLLQAEQDLAKLPEGRLKFSFSNKKLQYYYTRSGDEKKMYIPSSKRDLVNQLAQQNYLNELIPLVKKELQDISSFMKKNHLGAAEQVFRESHPHRKSLISPYMVDNETFAELWLEHPFDPNPAFPEELIYPTRRGERVRTKAEALIADMYYDLGVPYKYECPVRLLNGKQKYPDFTLLNKVTRKVYFHEHLGLLDDSGYRKDNMIKLSQYRQIGIYTGKNLILTHETKDSPLDLVTLRKNTIELFQK